jgi:phage shock protein E
MKQLFLFLLLITGISCQAQNSKILSQEEYKKAITGKDLQLIDVRTPEEFKNGHIKNAKNINFNGNDFKSQMEKLDKSKPLYIYCQSGGRSGRAAKILSEMGFKQIYDLKGGFGSWKD